MTTQLYKGDALDILRTLPTASVDAIITDPPYSSGGLMRSDKMKSTAEKYMVAGGGQDRPDFSGDNRDQRSWVYWCALWIGECRRVLKPGGYFMAFTDWRQLPACTDAVQAGGIVWRSHFLRQGARLQGSTQRLFPAPMRIRRLGDERAAPRTRHRREPPRTV